MAQNIKLFMQHPFVIDALRLAVIAAISFTIALYISEKTVNVPDATIHYQVSSIQPYDCDGVLRYTVTNEVTGTTVFDKTMLVIFDLDEDHNAHVYPSADVNVFRKVSESLPPVDVELPMPDLHNGNYELRFAAQLWGAGVAGFTVPFTVDCQ